MKRMILGVAAVAAVGLSARADVTWWAVPAMSEVQRLPDAVPTDGALTGTVRIVVAQNEYEPGSFVLRSDRDLGKVRLELGEFKQVEKVGGGGERETGAVFPKENLDLKVVKVWYQNRNGWFGYFADDGYKLCPELLLNDEDLIRVDTEKAANYARLVEKDGRTHEWWLNPPRQMNSRYFDYHDQPDAFPFMRENFRDAKTLQPVALPKDVSKQFFLTVRVKGDVAPGLYRGEVKVYVSGQRSKVKGQEEGQRSKVKGQEEGQRSKVKGQTEESNHHCLTSDLGPLTCIIPVSIRVLDFELPQPMAYFHPEQRMMISSYSYLLNKNIRLYNGGDKELAWRQLEAILADQVAHGQDIHWVGSGEGGTGGSDVERVIEIMHRVGMRKDVLMGGVDVEYMCTNRTMMTAMATRIADYYQRTLGHHNLYKGYGDEPSCHWLTEARPVFDSYHAGGIKFVIASQNGILWKCGYNWNWHNASDDAVDSTAPAKWNEMGSDTYCAPYSCMHVGPENPAYNRRQYGLGAWLAGYSAFCNYAHHLGSYDDEGDDGVYKPMVFAYGCYDGVLDTIQWEGFREGIDDIRYGTLLKALAAEAAASGDVRLSELGRKSQLYFASFKRERDDLDTARAEMITRILELRAALGAKRDVKIVAKKPAEIVRKPLPALALPEPAKTAKTLEEAKKLASAWVDRNDLKGAIAVYESLLKDPDAKPAVRDEAVKAIGGLYERFYDFEAARKYYLAKGLRLKAAAVQGRKDAARRTADRQLVLDVFRDEKEQVSERLSAYGRLLRADDPAAFAELDAYVKLCGATKMADGFLSSFTYHETRYAFYGNWEKLNWMLDAVEKYDAANTNRTWDFKTAQYAAEARLAVGDEKGALTYIERGLKKARSSKRITLERYQLEMMKVAYAAKGDVAAIRTAVAKADAEFGKGIDPEMRRERLQRVGSIAMVAGREVTVRALAAHVDALVKPMPTRTYAMRYSEKAIEGLGGWSQASVKPEVAKMDRPFGGSMDFVETDVSSGDRGEVQKEGANTYARPPEWQAAFDDWGVHFRVEIFDEKARDIELGALGAGSVEGYLAPGENTPYYCFMNGLKAGGLSVWNTGYDRAGHRRIDEKDRVNCREEIAYTDNSVVAYWAFSWDRFATCVPTDGALWEFEPCLWGRKGNATWNGLRSVHGRSSWGKLRFEMPSEARARILRRRLIAAKAAFQRERTSEALHEGVIDHWWDAEVGDRRFFRATFGKYVARLEAASKPIGPKMSDEDVFKLEKPLLGDLHDFRFRAQALRTDYLLKNLTE